MARLAFSDTLAAMRKYLLLVPLLLAGCPSNPSNGPCPSTLAAPTPCVLKDAAPPSPAPVVVDAAPSPKLDVCGLGEANLIKLGCKDDRGRLLGGPDLHGVSWAAVCRADQSHNVNMQPGCMAAAKNCEEVSKCR